MSENKPLYVRFKFFTWTLIQCPKCGNRFIGYVAPNMHAICPKCKGMFNSVDNIVG